MPEYGEVTRLDERLVLAGTAGRIRFLPDDESPVEGQFLLEGDPIAVIRAGRDTEAVVETRFRGWVRGWLVIEGQPVNAGEPVAWLTGVDA